MGCDDLTVVTDHKPLTKLLGDRTLDEIPNTRLFWLKQRTLPWYFQIVHLPGRSNNAADATSGHPSPNGTINHLGSPDLAESALMAFIKTNTSALSLSWDIIAKHTASHPDMQMLLSCINSGFQEDHRFDPAIKPYWQYSHALYELDGVILYDDRVVIPPNLRSSVLQTLHSAHQGVSSMEARARCTVFWPGMTADIHQIRDTCPDCIRHAPSQPRQPPASPSIPSTPFESIASDFFQLSGHHYLVIADRLSGWPVVFKSPPGSPQSGAHGLISCLINYFARFGIPEELSSDGGPEFTASATEDFLKRWNIRHRLSPSYLPQSNGRAEVAVKSVKRLL